MKTEKRESHNSGRRKFLRSSTVVGLGVASVAAVPGTAGATEAVKTEADVAKGYRLSGHVLEYYKTLAV